MTQPNRFPNFFMQRDEKKSVASPKSQRKVPEEEFFDDPARITSIELAPIHSVKSGTLQNACSTCPRVIVDLGKKCSYAHRQVEEQPSKRSKKEWKHKFDDVAEKS